MELGPEDASLLEMCPTCCVCHLVFRLVHITCQETALVMAFKTAGYSS